MVPSSSYTEAAATYDPLASTYAVDSAFHFDDIAVFVNKAGIQEGETVLDLGTGIGWVAIEARRHTQGRIMGIDASQEMVKEARRVAKEQNIQVAFLKGDMITMEGLDGIKPTEGFDVITCLWAFSSVHSSQRIAMLNRWKSFLAPTGRIVFDMQDASSRLASCDVYNQNRERMLRIKIHDTQILDQCKAACQSVGTQAGLQLVGALEQLGGHGYADHSELLKAVLEKYHGWRIEQATADQLEEGKWTLVRILASIHIENNPQSCMGPPIICHEAWSGMGVWRMA
jgi:ubiquinone/menaquinone biosynthesis C-methylase UbiE